MPNTAAAEQAPMLAWPTSKQVQAELERTQQEVDHLRALLRTVLRREREQRQASAQRAVGVAA